MTILSKEKYRYFINTTLEVIFNAFKNRITNIRKFIKMM